jgi:L-aspartate oxidase
VVCVAAPDLPPPALAQLRQAMSRDAGVVRTAAGLTRLLAEIDALEAAHGRAAPLVAARLVAACALARTESRGGHYRADASGPQPPRRTFLRWTDLPVSSTLRYAAE